MKNLNLTEKIQKAIELIKSSNLPEKDKTKNINQLTNSETFNEIETANGWNPETWAEFIIFAFECDQKREKETANRAKWYYYKKTFDMGEWFPGYSVRVEEDADMLDFTLVKNNGLEGFMFGLFKKDIKDEWQIRDLIASNIETYIKNFEEDEATE